MFYLNFQIKDLEEKQSIAKKKQRKLFPDIEKEVNTVKEAEVKDADDIKPKEVEEVSSVKAMPFELPPRDYDIKDSPIDVTGTKDIFKNKVPKEVVTDNEKLSTSRKSSSSSSSSSDDEKPIETDVVVADVVEEAPISRSDMNVEEVSPGWHEDFEKEKFEDVAPVATEDDLKEAAISRNNKVDEAAELENVVYPLEKPPITYNVVLESHPGIQLESDSLPLKLQRNVVEDTEEAEEKEEDRRKVGEVVPEVVGDVEIEPRSTYQNLIERGFKGEIESKTFDEDILKDLPESSVDSDSEIIASQGMKPEKGGQDEISKVESIDVKDTKVDSISTEPPSYYGNVGSTVAERQDEYPSDHVASLREDIPSSSTEKKGEIVLNSSEKDRSSFMEAFSNDPSFGSWFSGERTILEQDNGDKQAEEIASKVEFQLFNICSDHICN